MRLTFKWTVGFLTNERFFACSDSISWFSASNTMDVSSTYYSVSTSCTSPNRYCIPMAFCIFLQIYKEGIIIGKRTLIGRRKVERHDSLLD
jgi:hypothetical protein